MTPNLGQGACQVLEDAVVLREYVEHYDIHCPHRTLGQRPPAGYENPTTTGTNIRVLRRNRLGGLIHEYSQVA